MVKCADDDVIFRPALYIGSFAVEDGSQVARVNKVQSELEARRVFKQYKKLLVCVSTRGIKICSLDTKVVYMAHALRRISYATCDSEYKQVVFLAREPRGEANLQYCHVFVTEDSAKAEELNRIIGDAFQLAYARQYLSRMQRTGNQATNGAANPEAAACQPTQGPLFRLTDRHPRWPVDSGPVTSCRLELPPPPDCPPPPPVSDDAQGHHWSPDRERDGQSAAAAAAFNSRLGSPEQSADSGGNQQQQQQQNNNNPEKSKPDDLAERLNRISTSQISDITFLRKHFLRRSEGKGPLTATGADASAGSLFQPVRRRHGLSDLFRSSARHSAFLPSSMMRDLLPSTAESHLSDSSEPMEAERPGRHKPAPPLKSPPFILDLRTFYGGSPVVALKERLDAEAVADAKARAIAEATAVLAAAKLAAAGTAAAATSPHSSPPAASRTGATSAEAPLSNGGDQQQRHQQQRPPQQQQWSEPLAPVPPARMFSLPRHRQPPGFEPPRLPSSGLAAPERVYDQTAEEDENDGRAALTASRSTSSGNRRLAPASHRLSLVDSQMHAFSPVRAPALLDHRAQTNTAATASGAHRSHSPPTALTSRLGFQPSYNPGGRPTTTNFHAPLHVIADSRSRQQQQQQPAGNGSLSTDTPTPTPTVTPTPTQVSGTDEMDLLLRRAQLPREIAFELLTREEVGSFLIRNSITYPDCCALSVRVPKLDNPTGITHYLIQRTNQGGVRLKGLDKEWPSLSALITHLTVIPEMLPCPLRLPVHCNNPTFTQADSHQHQPAASLQRQTAKEADTAVGPTTTRARHQRKSNHPRYAAEDPAGTGHRRRDQLQEQRTVAPPGNGPISSGPVGPRKQWVVPKAENGTEKYTDSGGDDDDDDEDYQRLSDFSSLLADLK